MRLTCFSCSGISIIVFRYQTYSSTGESQFGKRCKMPFLCWSALGYTKILWSLKTFFLQLLLFFLPSIFPFSKSLPQKFYNILTKFAAIIDLFYCPQIGFDLFLYGFYETFIFTLLSMRVPARDKGIQTHILHTDQRNKCNWKLNAIMYRFGQTSRMCCDE